MARKKVSAKKKSNETKDPKSSKRKIEILGIIIIAIGILMGISIATYQSGDNALLSKLDFNSLFSSEEGPAVRIKNGLGPIGAWISHFFVFLGFGYGSIVIPILTIVYGWYVFRSKQMSNLNWGTLYSLLMMVLFSVIAGWFAKVNNWTTVSWSGTSGEAISNILYVLLSPIGSGIILFVLTLISLLFLIDRDIQVTIDKIKAKIIEIRGGTTSKATEVIADVKHKIEEVQIAKKDDIQDVKKENESSKEATIEETKVDINKVLNESIERDKKKLEEDASKKDEDLVGNRAILDKKKAIEEPLEEKSEQNEPEVKVYVGEDEEEAGKREIKKMQQDSVESKPLIKYKFPSLELLDSPPNEGKEVDMDEINENKRIILEKLKMHGIEIVAIDAIVGPTVTLYELTPAPNVKISKIESYANDLKMVMAAKGIRIIAPIPGKSAVGIEVPNQTREIVYIKQVINTKKFVESKMNLPIAFGKTIENEIFMVDLAKCPHLLVAGATGSGKSVGINTIITCLLYKCHPENLKFVLVDPKKIELALYRSLEKHYLATLPNMEEPIITDTSKVLEALNSVTKEMDERYDLLKLAMVRDLKAYNEKFANGSLSKDDGHRHLPYIVVVIDELADLMMTAGKQVEEPIARIAQLARAVGIHLVIATQRPSVNVITGTIKANFPSRIAYQVASKIDSRTILDTMGADQLVGRGDMLYAGGGPMIRVQNAFVSTDEVERINTFIENQPGYDLPYYLPEVESEDDTEIASFDRSERDALFEEAAKVIVLHQQGSVSLLQRKLRLGYNRAGRLIDQLHAAGVVGPYQGSTARDVLIQTDEELEDLLRNIDE